MRFGIGIDIHPFADQRRLVLGGVEIAHRQGLAGHSDADAAVHALADAILGALGLGDIGRWFPADDPQLEGMDSLVILRRVGQMMGEKGYLLGNADLTIMAEQPRLLPHLEAMAQRMAEALGADRSAINVKATRGEGLGFVGRCEGIAALAVVGLVPSSAGMGLDSPGSEG